MNQHNGLWTIGGECAEPNCNCTVLLSSPFCSFHQSGATNTETTIRPPNNCNSSPKWLSSTDPKYVARKCANPFSMGSSSRYAKRGISSFGKGPLQNSSPGTKINADQNSGPGSGQANNLAYNPTDSTEVSTSKSRQSSSVGSHGTVPNLASIATHNSYEFYSVSSSENSHQPMETRSNEQTMTVENPETSSFSANSLSHEVDPKPQIITQNSLIGSANEEEQRLPTALNVIVRRNLEKGTRHVTGAQSTLSFGCSMPQQQATAGAETIASPKLPAPSPPVKLSGNSSFQRASFHRAASIPGDSTDALDSSTYQKWLKQAPQAPEASVSYSSKTASVLPKARNPQQEAKKPRTQPTTKISNVPKQHTVSEMPGAPKAFPPSTSVRARTNKIGGTVPARGTERERFVSFVNKTSLPSTMSSDSRRLKRLARFDSGAFDAAIYRQPESRPPGCLRLPMQPRVPAKLVNKDRLVAVAMNPAILGMHTRSEEWYREKVREIEQRPHRKTWFGKVAERERWLRLKQKEKEAHRRKKQSNGHPGRQDPQPRGHSRILDFGDVPEDELPDYVQNNRAWKQACAWHRQVRLQTLKHERETKKANENRQPGVSESLRGHKGQAATRGGGKKQQQRRG